MVWVNLHNLMDQIVRVYFWRSIQTNCRKQEQFFPLALYICVKLTINRFQYNCPEKINPNHTKNPEEVRSEDETCKIIHNNFQPCVCRRIFRRMIITMNDVMKNKFKKNASKINVGWIGFHNHLFTWSAVYDSAWMPNTKRWI